MITQKILKILKKNSQFINFIENSENFKILIKNLKYDDFNRISLEYPNFILLNNEIKINEIENQRTEKIYPSVLSITIVKSDTSEKNYQKLKKIKLYFDIKNYKTIKILEN